MNRPLKPQRIRLLPALALITALVPGLAHASCALATVRLGSTLVAVGDTERRVLDTRPDRSIRLETEQGGAAGIRHDFHQRSVTVQVYVRAGQVTRICRLRN